MPEGHNAELLCTDIHRVTFRVHKKCKFVKPDRLENLGSC
jgi:hypothetical protein